MTGPLADLRRIVLLHGPEWKMWHHAMPQLPDVELRTIDLRLLSGAESLPPWLPRPRRAVARSQRAARPARGAAASARAGFGDMLIRRAVGRHKNPIFLFTDQERLAPAVAERLVPWVERLEQRGTVLNHPTRTLRRYALLRELHARGLNSFSAHRASDPSADVRFPAFLRREDDHDGPITTVDNPEELAAAKAAVVAEGGHLDRWLVIERIEVPQTEGWTPKYSAFRFGDAILPKHVIWERDWIVKEGASDVPGRLRELEWTYLQDNPHEVELRHIFDVAGMTYGRIDYAIVDGRLETFEINSNPQVIGAVEVAGAEKRVRDWFLEEFNACVRDHPQPRNIA